MAVRSSETPVQSPAAQKPLTFPFFETSRLVPGVEAERRVRKDRFLQHMDNYYCPKGGLCDV